MRSRKPAARTGDPFSGRARPPSLALHILRSALLVFLFTLPQTTLADDPSACEKEVAPLGILHLFLERYPSTTTHEILNPISVPTPENPNYTPIIRGADAADSAADLIEKNLGTMPSPESVVYPASGFDAATPFKIFRSAREVIGIDTHPFWLNPDRPFAPADPRELQAVSGWVTVMRVDELKEMGPYLFNRLANNLPGFRARRVVSFRQTEIPDMGEISHGLIEFDQGEGTPLKRYIHIHSPERSEWSATHRRTLPHYPLNDWWLPSLRTQGFGALLQKAAMAAFEFPNSPGSLLLRTLQERGGIYFDGDNGSARPAGPLEYVGDGTAYPALGLRRNERMVPTYLSYLGYSHAVIRFFAPPDPSPAVFFPPRREER